MKSPYLICSLVLFPTASNGSYISEFRFDFWLKLAGYVKFLHLYTKLYEFPYYSQAVVV